MKRLILAALLLTVATPQRWPLPSSGPGNPRRPDLREPQP